MGETAAPSLSRGMRRGQVSSVNKPLKKQAREPWNERKEFMVLPVRRIRFKKDIFSPCTAVVTELKK
jgi:hypothetical protein